MEFSIMFFLGFLFSTTILEPIIINFIYFKNIDLFIDLILTKKNQDKLVNRIIDLKEKGIL